MSYLVCGKCGGYYELQEGEHPEDFAGECECGGELKHLKSDNSNWKIDIKALIVGIIITSVLFSFRFIGGQYYFINYIAPFLGGFLTAYISEGSRKSRVYNSVVVMIIVGFGAPLLLLLKNNTIPEVISMVGIMGIFLALLVIFIFMLIFVIIGAPMGYLAATIKDKSSRDYKEPSFELNVNNKPSMVLVVLGYIFAISGGLIGLFIGWHLFTKKNPNAKFHGRNITVIATISIIIGLLLFFLYPNY